MTFEEALSILTKFLDSPQRSDACLNIHQFQGAVAAVTSCPEYVSEVDLGFYILGDDPQGEDQWFDEGEIRMAWVTCLNEIDETLALERFSLADHYPVDVTMQRPSAALSDWCDGYLRGYMLTESSWQEAYEFLGSEGIPEMEEDHQLFLSLLASFEDWQQAVEDNSDPEQLKNGFPLLFKAVDDGVTKFHKLGLLLEGNRMRAEEMRATYRRDTEKTGRNDPCPCGSGKKYKKCCGKAA